MRAILIDDEEMALDVLEILCTDVGGVEIVGKYTNPLQALEAISKQPVDVVFLDIEMPGRNGLEVAETILLSYDHIQIVFVTAYNEYAVDAFEVNAIDYLLKPIRKERLQRTIQRLQKNYTTDVPAQQDAAQPTPKLCCLGALTLYDQHDQIVKWRTKKTKELFCYLWSHKQQAFHRDALLLDIWPDIEQEKATPLLHTSIYQVRSTLKKLGFTQPILFADEKYTLHVPGLVSDVDVVEEILHMSPNQVSEATLDMMLSIYTGDYMEDMQFLWASGYQQHLQKEYVLWLETAFHSTTHIHMKERIMHKLIEIKPYHDDYYSLLLHHYMKIGNDSAAIDLYHRLEALLEKDLGEKPNPELQSLYQKFLIS